MNEILEILKGCCIDISILINNGNPVTMSSLIQNKNNSGDNVKRLDIEANDLMINKLLNCKFIRTIASEENDIIINTKFTNAPYMICFDPIDGSSNIDVNITVGTIFGLYQYDNNKLISGHNIVMAGYCLYGGSTQLIIAKNNSVDMYSLINNNFKLIKNNIKIKNNGNIYSINESNKYKYINPDINKTIDKFIELNYTARWVGSLVSDAHRTLIKGGFFTYPENTINTSGRIRLIYEGFPIAYIIETADGKSSNCCSNKSLLDLPFPINNIHMKTGILLSSSYEYNLYNSILKFEK